MTGQQAGSVITNLDPVRHFLSDPLALDTDKNCLVCKGGLTRVSRAVGRQNHIALNARLSRPNQPYSAPILNTPESSFSSGTRLWLNKCCSKLLFDTEGPTGVETPRLVLSNK